MKHILLVHYPNELILGINNTENSSPQDVVLLSLVAKPGSARIHVQDEQNGSLHHALHVFPEHLICQGVKVNCQYDPERQL